MFRILGQISIYGSKSALDSLHNNQILREGTLKQIGLARKVPDIDYWSYASPWYRFRSEKLDDEIQNFLVANKKLGKAIGDIAPGIRYSFFTLSPVAQNEENLFSCLLSNETLEMLSKLHLALEISPASVKPNGAYWIK